MALVPTAFGDIPIDEAKYRCADCGHKTVGPDDTGSRQRRKPACELCGGETDYSGPVLPEPIASEGWTSSAIARYWQARRQPEHAPDTQLGLGI